MATKYIFLNGPAFTPPPPLVARPLVDELFFAASLSNTKYYSMPLAKNIITDNLI